MKISIIILIILLLLINIVLLKNITAAGGAVVSLNPADQHISVGDTFTVTLRISRAVDLDNMVTDILFDNTKISYDHAVISGGMTSLNWTVDILDCTPASLGCINLLILSDAVNFLNGDADIITLYFTANVAGANNFTYANNFAYNTSFEDITSGWNPAAATIMARDSSAKNITSFDFAGLTPAVVGVIAGTNIALTVPYGTEVTVLAPTIATSTGASVSPASGAAQNFTSPVTYTVTAADGSTQDYTVTVIMEKTAPVLTTSIPTSVSTSTITLNGAITNNGGADAIESGFTYGASATLADTIATSSLGSLSGNASFSENLSGLTPNTLYYIRAYAVNSAGTSTGEILSTTTLAVSAPTVTTEDPTVITDTTATGKGNITATGNINSTVRGVRYGTTISYGASTTPETGDFSTGAFTASITSLICNTLYHVAAYATNSQGTSYGSDVTFTTSACPVTTPAPSGGGSSGGGGITVAYCSSVIYRDWGLCVNGFQYRLASSSLPSGCSLTAAQQLDGSRACVTEALGVKIYNPEPIVKISLTQLEQIQADAAAVYNYNQFTALNATTSALYNLIIRKSSQNLTDQNKYSMAYYIHAAAPTTIKLGAGERTGVLNSYLTAFVKLPRTLVEWQDVIKIANGRWPGERNGLAEIKAKASFKKIYGREAKMADAHDNAAVTVMAYGLRPSARNLNSEKNAILAFKHFIKRPPVSAVDWDIVRAIAYSGAKR